MKKKLAIIGAKNEQVPLILKAKKMGIETHCFAWDKKEEDTFCKGIADYFHPISILDKELILEKCREIGIDGVTSIAYDYAVPTIGYVTQNMGLPGNIYEDMLIALNKYKSRLAFQKAGVHSPRFAVAHGGALPDISAFTYPLIVKPTDRCASVGVMKVEKENELENAVQRALELSFIKEAIIEEYISGIEASVESISWKGNHYHLAITDKETTGAPYYVEIAHHEPSALSAEIQEKMKTEAGKALTAINYSFGATDTEVKVNENGDAYIIEANPRMGGDYTHELIRLSTGYDFLKGVIDIALNQFEAPVLPLNKYSGIYFLSKDTEWVKHVIENKEHYPEIDSVEIFFDELIQLQSSFDRSGYFTYQSDRKKTTDDYLI